MFALPLLVPMAWLACTADTAPPEAVDDVAPVPPAPTARVDDVVDSYFGQSVPDPYRWLEDATDPMVEGWSEAQNMHARAVLDTLSDREALRSDLSRILGAERTTHAALKFGGSHAFALRRQPPKRQKLLVELSSLDAGATHRVIVDPEALDPTGLTTIDLYAPSPDGSKVAVSLSRGGTESGDLYVYDTQTLAPIGDPIPRVNGGTAGGAVAWTSDGTGLYYTRYPREGERPPEDMAFHVQLWQHTLGTDPATDRYEIGKDFPRIGEIDLEVHPRTGRLLVTVQDGDGGQFAHWLRGPNGQYRQLSTFGDKTVMLTFSEDGASIYAVSFTDAPHGKILRMPVTAAGLAAAKVVVPEGDDVVVTSFWSSPTVRELGGKLFVEFQTGGPSEMRVFDLQGKQVDGPEQFPIGALGAMVPAPDGSLVFSNSSYVQPWTWLRFDPATGATTRLAVDDPAVVDLSGMEIRREMATSKDGTQVPLNILMRRGLPLDGSNPCVATGYGGYGVNETPDYDPAWAPALDNGVIVVFANLRGGGEFGETWHEQGSLIHKQNVFDDFFAVLQHLVVRGYTSPERLGLLGGSNGGLLMGATVTQHPDGMAAVASAVGIYDMLRVELSANGAFNVTEYGTVQDPAQFAALYAYSPYHHVVDGTAYPPILFTTGANDPRVDPMQSRKMTARMQAATTSPVLLRTSHDAGHGSATPLDERIALKTDLLAFLLHHIGVQYTPMEWAE